MTSKPEQMDICAYRGMLITNKVYICLEGPSACPYKVSFGYEYFCISGLEISVDRAVYKMTQNSDCRRYKLVSHDGKKPL